MFYLKASAAECLRRLRTSATVRPLLAADDVETRVNRLFAERRELYEAIGRAVDTEGLAPEEVAREIAREVRDA